MHSVLDRKKVRRPEDDSSGHAKRFRRDPLVSRFSRVYCSVDIHGQTESISSDMGACLQAIERGADTLRKVPLMCGFGEDYSGHMLFVLCGMGAVAMDSGILSLTDAGESALASLRQERMPFVEMPKAYAAAQGNRK